MSNIRNLTPSNEQKNESIPEHLQDLPEELLKELSAQALKGKQTVDEKKFIDCVNAVALANNGEATTDQILIGYYRQTGQVLKRNALTARLQKLEKKGLIKRPNKRTYAVPDQS